MVSARPPRSILASMISGIPSSWALEPECDILMFVRHFGPLGRLQGCDIAFTILDVVFGGLTLM